MILFTLPGYEYLAVKLLSAVALQKGEFSVQRFPNKELLLSVKTRVSGERCILLGRVFPGSEDLEILTLLSQTLKKAGAPEVTAVLPYLDYSRQDEAKREKSLGCQWLGRVLAASVVDKVVTIDVHSEKVAELFPIPLVSLPSTDLFAQAIKKEIVSDFSLVAPDEGGIERCRLLVNSLGLSNKLVYFHKERTSSGVKLSEPVGKVLERVIIVDDILDTGATLVACVEKLQRSGVKDITIMVTHGLFTGNSWQKLWDLAVSRILCTDTIPLPKSHSKIKVISVAPLLTKYFHG